MTKHTKRDHATLGGSSAHRWTNCYGSVSLIKSLGELPRSEAAEKGTLLHEAAEATLKAFLHHKITGENILDGSKIKPVEDIDDALALVDGYVKSIFEVSLEGALTGKVYGMEDEFMLSEELDMWGIPDFWAIYVNDKAQRVGVIEDFKSGFHFVTEKKNAQLAFYACALRKWVQSKGKDLDVVYTGIYQQTSNVDAPVHRRTKITAKQLDAWEKKFFKAAHDILIKKKTTLKCGPWCTFCAAQGVCTAYAKETCVKNELKLIDVSEITLPEVEKLSDEQIKKIVINKGLLEDFIKAVSAYALQRMNSANPIEGMKLVEGRSRRCWRDNDAEIIEALRSLGLDDPVREKPITISEAEKLLKQKVPQSLTTTTRASLHVVPADDPRPSITSNVEVMPIEN